LLAELVKELDCVIAGITFHDPENVSPKLPFSVGLSQDEVREWTEEFGAKNPRTPEALRATLQAGYWVRRASLSEDPAHIRNSDYARWLRDRDCHHSMILAAPCGSGAATVSLGGADPFSENAE
jgi:hypothetical protein